ncbi:glycosyltransferase family 4 protein [Priestia megaterium]|uniref:glycosyltransferase family 4 protein n=1 Tax=Priestia megaterium TaxID=1404 RepID=UPI001F1880B8|nr:glycosyltransferase family 4 protein [Priestia megaterium]MCF8888193.1 glycosyltransferase family 4 protein [Priestia megaterium]
MKKILFAGHDLKFACIIMDRLASRPGFEIKTDEWSGHNAHDEEHSQSCLEWADVIVCEWGLGNAVWYSQHKKPHQQLIVRMHLQERDTIYPHSFNIENIDKIIAISPYVYEEFYRTFNFPREKMTMIYNVVDTEKVDAPKTEDAKYHLGIIGICPQRKRLDLAVDMLDKLWHQDNRYKLFVKGKMPQEYSWLWNKEEEREYYEAIFNRIEKAPWKDAVIFEGFGDISEWLSKIGIILSTSDFESFHLSPSEGMASGAYPIILNWDGSDTIYPKEYLLSDVEEAVERILALNSKEMDAELQASLKEYVKQHFGAEKVTNQWEDLIVNVAEPVLS